MTKWEKAPTKHADPAADGERVARSDAVLGLLAAMSMAENALRWAAQEARGKIKKEIVGGILYHAEQARAAIARAEGRE